MSLGVKIIEERLRNEAGYRRTFQNQAFQIDNYQVVLTMSAPAGVNSYPILQPAPGANGSIIFQEDVVVIAVYLSGAFLTVAAAEDCCVAVGRAQKSNLNVLGPSNTLLNTYCPNFLAGPAGDLIQRNIGTSFPTPFQCLKNANTGLQLFGSVQATANWKFDCTVSYCKLPDYRGMMAAIGRGE